MIAMYNARAEEETFASLSPEQLLRENENNFEIPYSEIESVELKKIGLGGNIKNTTTAKDQYKWNMTMLVGNRKWRFNDIKQTLQPIFNEKLVISKLL